MRELSQLDFRMNTVDFLKSFDVIDRGDDYERILGLRRVVRHLIVAKLCGRESSDDDDVIVDFKQLLTQRDDLRVWVYYLVLLSNADGVLRDWCSEFRDHVALLSMLFSPVESSTIGFPAVVLCIALGLDVSLRFLLLDVQVSCDSDLCCCSLLGTPAVWIQSMPWLWTTTTQTRSVSISFFDNDTRTLHGIDERKFRTMFGGATYVSNCVFSFEYVEFLLCSAGGGERRIDIPQVLINRQFAPSDSEFAVMFAKMCENQLVPSYNDETSALVIAHTGTDAAYGVFAGKQFRKGELVTLYLGHVVPVPSTLGERIKRTYAFGMELFDGEGRSIGGFSNFHVNAEHLRNIGPFLNHSRFSANVVVEWFVWGGCILSALCAKRDIVRGEQLCYNYGDAWFDCRGMRGEERDMLGDSAPLQLPGFLRALAQMNQQY
jgi:hypothetical protein